MVPVKCSADVKAKEELGVYLMSGDLERNGDVVLVHSGISNNTTDVVAYKQKNHFSHFWRLESEDQVPEDLVSGIASTSSYILLYLHTVEEKGSSLSLFFKGTNPIHEVFTFCDLISPPMPSLLTPLWG